MSNPSIWDPESPVSLVRQLLELFMGTSTTTNTIGTGNKTFVTQEMLYFNFGAWLLILDAGNSSNYMTGQVVSYDPLTGNLVLNSIFTSGSGAHNNWIILVSGAQAASTFNGGTVAGVTNFNAAVNFNAPVVLTDTLTLAADPVSALQAATKQYVDARGSYAGEIRAFCHGALPAGWLECNGAAVNRVGIYATLFALIGTAYGPGDGVNTFNIPNLSRRTIVGRGGASSAYLCNTLACVGGEEVHQMTVNELVQHNHVYWKTDLGTGGTGTGGVTPTIVQAFNNTNNTGNSVPFNIMQPSVVMMYGVKY